MRPGQTETDTVQALRRSIPSGPHPNGSLLDRIGNTPMIEIRRCWRPGSVRIFAKCEWFNPGGSVKDRAALSMIQDGLASGRFEPGKTILDATSGNTGIAYAMIGAIEGYPVKLALPANASPERIRILQGYGAELILTDPLLGTDGAIQTARQLSAEDPERFFYPDQYSNDANWRAHFGSTAPEIFRQTRGLVTHLVAGLGTSGTFVGTTRGLRRLNSSVQCISFMPDSPLHGLEGLKHMPSALIPSIYDPTLADGNLVVETEAAQKMVRRLAAEEGLLAGVSSGAALVAAIEVASQLERGLVVTIFPDGGQKYLAESFWRDHADHS